MPLLIEDLGLIHHGRSSKRVHFAIYSCPSCGAHFKARALKDLSCKSRWCRSCACTNNATKHGNYSHALYSTYTGMIERCESTSRKDSIHYSIKGISVCAEWAESFESFVSWAASAGYKKGLSIERNDNEKGYSPDNCKWIPKSEQSINRGRFSNNTSGFKGVSFMKRLGKFRAYIGVDRKIIYLGLHMTAEKAAAAYDDYVTKNGLMHPLNLPQRQ